MASDHESKLMSLTEMVARVPDGAALALGGSFLHRGPFAFVRELIRQDFVNAFEKVDALISPTSPVPAFKLGERTADPLQMYLADIFTIAANLAGICGISVPCGFAEVDGHRLPIGLQLLGKPLDEARILQTAHAYEQSTEWHKARPPIAATAQNIQP